MLSTLQELKIISSKWLDYLLRLQDKSNPVTTQFLTDEGYIPSHENPSRVYEPFNEDVSLKRRLVNFENSVAAKPRESERDYQLLIPPIIAINQDAFSRVGSPQRQDSFVHKNPTSPGKRVGSPERLQRHAYSSARSTISQARALVRQNVSMHGTTPERPATPQSLSLRARPVSRRPLSPRGTSPERPASHQPFSLRARPVSRRPLSQRGTSPARTVSRRHLSPRGTSSARPVGIRFFRCVAPVLQEQLVVHLFRSVT